MAYKALTYINIPPDNRKAPGDTISKKEFEDAVPPQGEDQINELLHSKAISEDANAEIHKDHQPIEVVTNTESAVNVVTGEVIEGSDSSA